MINLADRICPACHIAWLLNHHDPNYNSTYLKCPTCGFSRPVKGINMVMPTDDIIIELATEFECSMSAIRRWINGRSNAHPNIKKLFKESLIRRGLCSEIHSQIDIPEE